MPDINDLIQQTEKLTGDERVAFLLRLSAMLGDITSDDKARILLAFLGEESDLVLAALLCAMTYNSSRESYAKQKALAEMLCKHIPSTSLHRALFTHHDLTYPSRKP